ncbi:FAD-dependent oxidoreductase [Rhodococcus jostii]|uniref:ferredoxin--NADP(+) reductase n=1 Tax=Rhodococcus jostii TaxID=132919 RepID=A0A1H4ITU0_RHOJO|nr:FAD-dependent oxidoreductase [Rhodococcus jostii]SEB37056.1 ferredoxin--NADP+ reductase [Rhodococcus jostii]
MAYVITQPCCNDATCIAVCPVDCIRPTPDDPLFTTAEMLYIDPGSCIDCGACADACPVEAIFPEDALTEPNARYQTINAEYFERYPLEFEEPSTPNRPAVVPARDVPWRVAIVGSGPAACYAAQDLVTQGGQSVEVEMFDRLPTPWGLVRAGVSPDHPGTKGVTDIFRATVANPSFQFHLNVEIGKHLTHEELMAHHHAVVYAVGASSDRRLGVPGEELPGSHAATDFVAWYNGHPDYAGLQFDLTGERAVIVGNGNVALDVARILVSDPDNLAGTDIADHALAALRRSHIREVVVIGRRGPAQAAYTNPELIALGHLKGVDVLVDPADAELDQYSRVRVEDPDADPQMVLKATVAQEFSQGTPSPGNRRIVLRYLASPIAVLGEERAEGLEIVHNALVESADGTLRAQPTDKTETITTNLVLRSIGYRGTPVPGIPFDDARGTIPNEKGRVIDPRTGEPVTGVYTAGWIKRGPSGVIGTNRKCAQDTVAQIHDDLTTGHLTRTVKGRQDLRDLIRERQPDVVNTQGWAAIDEAERRLGKQSGRPRAKFTDISSMLDAALGAEAGAARR